ncbi:MAG: TonB-dependent receptor [Acidobacteriaceae bacterium]
MEAIVKYVYLDWKERHNKTFLTVPTIAFVLLLILTSAKYCFAQNSSAGDIRGTVSDQSGAVVPGATVTVLDTLTGVKTHYVTNGAGIYDTVSILPGNYTLTFSKDGFKTFVRSGIVLQVGATTINAKLTVGGATQQVVVNGEGTLLKTDTGEQSTTLTGKTMMQLPNVGVNWMNYMQTIPGVEASGNTLDMVSVNGNMPRDDNFQTDGASVTLPESGNPQMVSFETIAEVKVDTSNFGAEFGSGGAVMNQITKSGTNQFHGAAYEYIQNTIFNAKTYFTPVVPALHFNNWGGAIGGPVFVKNKIFFYFNYDKLHDTSASYPFYTYPTAQMRAGNFSDPIFPKIYDPQTEVNGVRQPFPNNIIPPNRIDPVAAKIQAYLPTPNLPGTVNNWHEGLTTSTPATRYFGRLDYDITTKNRLTADVYKLLYSEFLPSPDCPMNCVNGSMPSTQAQVMDVWTMSPSSVNQARMAFNRQNDFLSPPNYLQNYPQKIGLQYAEANIFPNVTVKGSTGFGGTGIASGTIAVMAQNVYDPSDMVTLIRGKHILKFGGEVMAYQSNRALWGNVQSGNFAFTGYYTQQRPYNSKTGMGFADFLLGQVQSWSATNSPRVGMRSKTAQAFAQDDWKPLPNLTVNIGFRYEYQGPWSEIHNRIGDFDPNIVNPATNTLGAIWFAGNNGRNTLQLPVNNFLPRLGFSWAPTDKWAVRGGFGMYTYLWSGDVYGTNAISFGADSTGSLFDYNQIHPVFDLSNPNPPLNYIKASKSPSGYNGQAVPYYPVHTPVAIVDEYSFSIQRQLNAGLVAQLAYVGSTGSHLSFPVDINQVHKSQLGPGNAEAKQPYPQFLAIAGDNYNAISNYNSLQASLKKEYKNGLTYDVNYTWSKMMDDQDSAGTNGASAAGLQPYQSAYHPSQNYGLSNFDLTYMLKGDAVYQLPFGKGRRYLNHNAIADATIGGWQASSVVNVQSGFPYTVVVGSANLSGAQGGSWYPNVVGNPSLAHPTVKEWFNPAAFAIPSAYTFGNSGRNTLRGPGLTTVNLSAGKNFPFKALNDAMNMQIRIDAFNALNHAVLANPNAGIGTPLAGTITKTRISGRILQLNARFSF